MGIGADAFATKAVAISPEAAIVAEISELATASPLTSGLAVERISAEGAAREPLKKVPEDNIGALGPR